MSNQATPAPAPPPVPAALCVSFDIQQTGNQLMWTSVQGAELNYLRHGPDAGLLQFDCGDSFGVAVSAYAPAPPATMPLQPPPPPPFTGFRVLGLALITLPQQGGGNSPASPFSGSKTAVTEFASVPGFSSCTSPTLKTADPANPYWESHSETKGLVSIDAKQHRWTLSLVLTVEISYSSGTKTRVFVLDPEAQVGNGTRETGS